MPTQKKSITLDDLYRLQVLSGVRSSPDGEHVIYTLQRVYRETESKYSNLWVVPTAGGAAQQFTQGDQSDIMPRWSPNGSQVACSCPNAPQRTFMVRYLATNGK